MEGVSAPQCLFAYGTLRSDCGSRMHGVLVRHARRVGTAWMRGVLYDTGAYPAALPTSAPDQRVVGELYEIHGHAVELFRVLDRYEGFRPDAPAQSLFRREQVRVCCEPCGERLAWVYVYNRSVSGLTAPPPAGTT